VGLKLVVKLKRQTGVWRLNAVTMTTTLPVGDPRIWKILVEPALAAPLEQATRRPHLGRSN